MEKVSVVIPCYNQGPYIDECVESVLNQTYKNIEIVIVDDGSNDVVSIEKLKQIEVDNKGINIIYIQNSGVSNARNIAIKNSTGKYILPLDADDKIEKTYIEKCVNVLENNKNIDIIYCITEFFGDKKGLFILSDFTTKEMLRCNLVICTAMFRRDDFDLVKGYNTNMTFGYEDWDFWLSMIEKDKKFYRINEVLFYYRIKKISRNADLGKVKEKEICMKNQIYINHKDLYKENGLDPTRKVVFLKKLFRRIKQEHNYIVQNVKFNYYNFRCKVKKIYREQ